MADADVERARRFLADLSSQITHEQHKTTNDWINNKVSELITALFGNIDVITADSKEYHTQVQKGDVKYSNMYYINDYLDVFGMLLLKAANKLLSNNCVS